MAGSTHSTPGGASSASAVGESEHGPDADTLDLALDLHQRGSHLEGLGLQAEGRRRQEKEKERRYSTNGIPFFTHHLVIAS